MRSLVLARLPALAVLLLAANALPGCATVAHDQRHAEDPPSVADTLYGPG
jgi:hypothetical protein